MTDGKRKRGYYNARMEIIVISDWNPNNPGRWITQECIVRDCRNSVGYWSNSGKETVDLTNAKCEKHVRK